MKKKFVILMLLILLVPAKSIAIGENKLQKEGLSQNIILFIEGKYIEKDLKSTPYFLHKSRTFISKKIMEDSGFKVEYNESNGNITVSKGELSIELNINSTQISRDKDIITMDVKPILKGQEIYVPITFVAKAFNINTTWNKEDREVVIGSKNMELSKADEVNVKLIEEIIQGQEDKYLKGEKVEKTLMGNRSVYTISKAEGNIRLIATFTFVEDKLIDYRFKNYSDNVFKYEEKNISREDAITLAEKFSKEYFKEQGDFVFSEDGYPSLLDPEKVDVFKSKSGNILIVVNRIYGQIVKAQNFSESL